LYILCSPFGGGELSVSQTLLKEKIGKSCKTILIAGVGNRLLADEGVGLHIIDNLSQTRMPTNVNIIDCGCDLLGLIPYLNEPQKIIVIDAIRAGGRPGKIYRFDYCELGTRDVKMRSSHQMGAIDAIGLLKQIYPALAGCEIIIVGLEPKAIKLSTCLSKEVKEGITDILRLIFQEINYSISISNRAERSLNYERGKFGQINNKISASTRPKILS
jgi:hydrogenase maturation protease